MRRHLFKELYSADDVAEPHAEATKSSADARGGEIRAHSLLHCGSRLSAVRVERELGLAPGSWRQRQLFALRAMADCLGGARRGDYLVVEPGLPTADESTVVIRDSSGLGLRRASRDSDGEILLLSADPTDLPFPAAGQAHSVIGTVIGIVSGPGRDRAATRAMRSRRQQGAPLARVAARRKRIGTLEAAAVVTCRAANRGRIALNIKRWDEWIAVARAAASQAVEAELPGAVQALQTLGACMDKADDDALYQALVREANRVIGTMHRRTKMMGGPRLLPLIDPLASAVGAARSRPRLDG